MLVLLESSLSTSPEVGQGLLRRTGLELNKPMAEIVLVVLLRGEETGLRVMLNKNQICLFSTCS